jgi:hypothetical protein
MKRPNPMAAIKAFGEKYSSFYFSEIVIVYRHPASMKRGVSADRHDTRGGERWTWMARETIASDADGEVVGSWRSGASAKAAMVLSHRADDGGNQAGPRGDLV